MDKKGGQSVRNDTIRSSWRSLRAVVKSDDAVFQEDRKLRFYDCFAAERRLRQLLQIEFWLN
ncbi:hypothetical protein ASC74_09235 [Pseudomonas sp. Root329]|nr:hypothetical protein ASC74_09235 [Pseudomonas sp. Root329]